MEVIMEKIGQSQNPVCTRQSGSLEDVTMPKNLEKKLRHNFLTPNMKYAIIPLFMLFVVGSVGSTLMFSRKPKTKVVIQQNFDSPIALGTHWLFPKNIWSGFPATNSTTLSLNPISLVLITDSGTNACFSIPQCFSTIENHRNSGFSDIRYNFFIGGDNNVYVDGGWDERNVEVNSIEICFIGNFTVGDLPAEMVESARNLLSMGAQIGKLQQDYRVDCRNATVNICKVLHKF